MYKTGRKGWLKHADFIILDLVVLQFSFLIACFIRHGIVNPYSKQLYLEMGMVIMLIDIACLFFLDTLKNVLKKGYYREFVGTMKNAMGVELLSIAYLFLTKEGEAYSRFIMIMMGGIYFALSYLSRIYYKKILKEKKISSTKRSMLIITSSDIGRDVVEDLQKNVVEKIEIAGIVYVDGKDNEITEDFRIVDVDEVTMYVCREWIDEVFIKVSDKYRIDTELIAQLEETGVVLHIAIAGNESKTGRKQIIEKMGKSTVITTTMNFFTPQQALYKRGLDIIGGIVGCILTVFLAIIFGPIIYINSPGPIFFKQVRIGKNGKKFKMYKFRSMYMDAEERKKELKEKNRIEGDFMFKMKFDPRIIGNRILENGQKKRGIGQFIRDTSIDEFPQFWNVLKGDMSLVGTRPPTEDEWNRYELHHRARLSVKPGITGMWQISGRSEITDFEEVVKLDTEYINRWSMGLDLKILVKTVIAVLNKNGSM